MNITVKYAVNVDRLREAIAKFPVAVSAAVKKSAFDIQDTAQALAPVDTGYLAGSITSTIEKFYAEIEPAAEYAAYVEFGTRKMEAQPFMRKSVDMHGPKFVAAIEEIMKGM